jgi:3-hydroxybutyryl-CoA dehydrogenase
MPEVMPEKIKTVCVVGAGVMGHQISTLAAIKGFETYCTDISREQLDKAQAFADKYLPERVAKGRLSQAEADMARSRLHFTSNLEEAASSADFVIEATPENLQLKRSVFAQLDAFCPPHATLATNSSSIVSSLVADATHRPQAVCNMHFFFPALVMSIVEVVKGPHTSQETAQTAVDMAVALGKTPVLVEKEIYGFVVDRILYAMWREAWNLVTLGIATPQAIDVAVEGALGHPMGPFRIIDLTGVDLIYDIFQGHFEDTGDPAEAPPQFLVDMIREGKLGKKSGSGFYEYSDTQAEE